MPGLPERDDMSLELKDFRGKITPETDVVLSAIARVTGKDKAEIARDWLHKLALEQIRIQRVMGGLLHAEGLAGESGGLAGDLQGTRGSARE